VFDLSPSPSPTRRGEQDFSLFPCREGGWGVRSVWDVGGMRSLLFISKNSSLIV